MRKAKLIKLGTMTCLSLALIAPILSVSCSDKARVVTFSFIDSEYEDYEGFTKEDEFYVVNGNAKSYAKDEFSASVLSGYTPIRKSYKTYSKNNIALFYFDDQDFLASNSFGKKPTDGNFADFEANREKTNDPTSPETSLKNSRYNDIKIMKKGDKSPVEYRWYTKTYGSTEVSGYYKTREDMNDPTNRVDLSTLQYKYDLLSSYSSNNKVYYTANTPEEAFELMLEENKILDYREVEVTEETGNGYWVFTNGNFNYFTNDWTDSSTNLTMYQSKKIVQISPSNLYSTKKVKAPTSMNAPALLNLFEATPSTTTNNFSIRKASIYKP